MTLFIALAAALTVLIIVWMVWPLLRPTPLNNVSSLRLNAAIYREQLDALERDLANGTMTPADYEATRDELQLRRWTTPLSPMPCRTNRPALLERTTHFGIAGLGIAPGRRRQSPLSGQPCGAESCTRPGRSAEQVIQMVESLAAKLQANPDNPKGWAMLARSCKVMGRLDEAAQAYAKASEAIPEPPRLPGGLRRTAGPAGRQSHGRPAAGTGSTGPECGPEHPSALMMSGVAAYQQGDFDRAAADWEKLLGLWNRAPKTPRSPKSTWKTHASKPPRPRSHSQTDRSGMCAGGSARAPPSCEAVIQAPLP
jgi:cytochrome c-type biogenesis protein CcmH